MYATASSDLGASGPSSVDKENVAQSFQQQIQIMYVGGSIPGSAGLGRGGCGGNGESAGMMDLCRPTVEGVEYLLDQVDDTGSTRLHLACRENPERVYALLDLGSNPCVRNNFGDTPLHCVATAELVDAMLQSGAYINARNGSGATPLVAAVRRGDVAVVTALLTAGADPTPRDSGGVSALDHACLSQNELLVRAMVGSGRVDVMSANKHGLTALHLVEGKALVDALVDAGANVRARDMGGRTALHYVCSKSNFTICALLSRGANINDVDSKLQTPLHRVTRGRDYPELVNFLLQKGADVLAQREDGKTPLHLAVQRGRVAVTKLLMAAGADPAFQSAGGTSSLMLAASNGYPCIVSMIIARGMDVNTADSIGQTPLHFSAHRGFFRVSQVLVAAGADPTLRTAGGRSVLDVAATHGRAEIVRMFVRRGIDVTTTDDLGQTPLHLAARHGRAAVTQVLLTAGANPLVRDSRERTPLDFAVKYGRLGVVGKFIEAGVDVNDASSGRNQTPLHFAVTEGFVAITQALVVAGADSNLRDSSDASPLDIAAGKGKLDLVNVMIQSGGADVTSCDSVGWTALHHSAKGGHGAVASALIRAGASVVVRNMTDASPLDVAAGFGREGVVRLLLNSGVDASEADVNGFTALHVADNENIVDMLIGAGADVNAQTVPGTTPLMYHAIDIPVVRTLLRHGALVNLRDNQGQTVLHMASHEAHMEGIVKVVDVLLKAGVDETILDDEQRRAEDCFDEESVFAVEARRLMRSAPMDRSWRRRGLLLMCMGLGSCDDNNVLAACLVDAREEVQGVFRTIVGYL